MEGDMKCELWKRCLAGYVVGKSPGFRALNAIIKDSWNCEASLTIHDSGWLVYKFASEEEKSSVLNGGPYLIYGRPLVLRPMSEYFNFSDKEMSNIPVWVKLPNLPLSCWTVVCLSKIASLLGKPIQCDRLTATMERLSYARVLIEMNIMEDLPKAVDILLPTGDYLVQPVIYETLPKHCKLCRTLDHSTVMCKHKSKEKLATSECSPAEDGQQRDSVFDVQPVNQGREPTAETEGWHTVKGRKGSRRRDNNGKKVVVANKLAGEDPILGSGKVDNPNIENEGDLDENLRGPNSSTAGAFCQSDRNHGESQARPCTPHIGSTSSGDQQNHQVVHNVPPRKDRVRREFGDKETSSGASQGGGTQIAVDLPKACHSQHDRDGGGLTYPVDQVKSTSNNADGRGTTVTLETMATDSGTEVHTAADLTLASRGTHGATDGKGVRADAISGKRKSKSRGKAVHPAPTSPC